MRLSSKLVRSIIWSPSTRIWGSTASTRKIEIKVPLLKQTPMAEMVGLVVICPISAPATARMEPEVKMVGKASFKASTMAFLGGISPFKSL